MNPYDVLGVPADAADAAIRSAYLGLVRQFPPERHPEKFNEINKAYNTLKSKESRLQYYLFEHDSVSNSPFGVVLAYFSTKINRIPSKLEELKEYLRICAIS